ncbi:MAG TPA: sulfide-dependent adenosine diphosphate thiazole synthase [Phycisphaerae bacterium]|nr:sulfide-dependent adenosine diphosphate thiazole synthase [Phycisphaerae bacterium]HNU46579.1 sulfide-dependent adenosine diphosphate thiazole synthase [Phycisphaerae bacterium]
MKGLIMTDFANVGEKAVTRAIVKGFADELLNYVESDVVVVGAGPAGLVAARDLATAGRKVLLIERSNYLGGGFWIGGYLMNKITVRSPAHEELERLHVLCQQVEPGLYVADGPHACAKLIASACEAGVRVLNLTSVEDVLLDDQQRVAGVVINWTPVQSLPRQITCVDPVALETKAVIDATGHDAAVARHLADRGLLKVPGNGAMNVRQSEGLVVERTGEVYPGLYVAGMAVASAFGLPRMGSTFGGMLLSGRRVAELLQQPAPPRNERGRTPQLVGA